MARRRPGAATRGASAGGTRGSFSVSSGETCRTALDGLCFRHCREALRAAGTPTASAKGEKMKKDLDELLDDVGAALE